MLKKVYKTQDEVLSQKHLAALIISWIFSIVMGYVIDSFTPVATGFVTELVFIAYMVYAEFRYTSIREKSCHTAN